MTSQWGKFYRESTACFKNSDVFHFVLSLLKYFETIKNHKHNDIYSILLLDYLIYLRVIPLETGDMSFHLITIERTWWTINK